MRIVGDYAETCIGGVLLHDSSEGHLGSRRHGVCFVKDDEFEGPAPPENICFVDANVLICSRTTSIPLSSDAFNSKTICRMFFGP